MPASSCSAWAGFDERRKRHRNRTQVLLALRPRQGGVGSRECGDVGLRDDNASQLRTDNALNLVGHSLTRVDPHPYLRTGDRRADRATTR